jgi:ADP-heptose:LPS heptosyltransferase
MDSVLECLPRDTRVAILRLRSLGDCVLTTPALDILKRSRPDLRLAVLVEDRFRAIFEDNPDVDQILPPELAALRRLRPQLCLNLHGGTRSAWMTLASGARYRAGFAHYRHQLAYNVRIPRAQQILGVPRTVHTAEHLASAMFYLGAGMGEIPRAKLMLRNSDPNSGLPRESVSATAVIHAVAATPEKTWPAAHFLTIAGHLAQTGLEPVFIGAATDDLSPFRAWRTVRGASLPDIKRLLGTAALFLGNDSGPAHMAAAFGLPTVVVFGASDPAIWGPWRTPHEIVTAPGGITPGDISQVRPQQVLEALERLRVRA